MGMLEYLMAQDAEKQQRDDLTKGLRGSGTTGTLSQFGPETAGQLGPLLTSDVPQLESLGASLLGQLMQAKAGPAAMPPPGPPQIGAPSFSDFTPESMAEYQMGGDPRVLQYRTDPMAEERLAIARDAEDRKRLMSGRLPVGQLEGMLETEVIDAGLDATAVSMKPEFFGFGFDAVANAATEYKSRTGSDTEFTSFWNELDSAQAIRRKDLFGATLTDNEMAAWQRLAIKPSDSYAAASAKLGAQKRLIAQKRQQRALLLQQQGYNTPNPRPPLSSFGGP